MDTHVACERVRGPHRVPIWAKPVDEATEIASMSITDAAAVAGNVTQDVWTACREGIRPAEVLWQSMGLAWRLR